MDRRLRPGLTIAPKPPRWLWRTLTSWAAQRGVRGGRGAAGGLEGDPPRPRRRAVGTLCEGGPLWMRLGASAMATTTGYHHALPAVTACAQAAALLNVRRGVSAIVESTTVCRWW